MSVPIWNESSKSRPLVTNNARASYAWVLAQSPLMYLPTDSVMFAVSELFTHNWYVTTQPTLAPVHARTPSHTRAPIFIHIYIIGLQRPAKRKCRVCVLRIDAMHVTFGWIQSFVFIIFISIKIRRKIRYGTERGQPNALTISLTTRWRNNKVVWRWCWYNRARETPLMLNPIVPEKQE